MKALHYDRKTKNSLLVEAKQQAKASAAAVENRLLCVVKESSETQPVQ